MNFSSRAAALQVFVSIVRWQIMNCTHWPCCPTMKIGSTFFTNVQQLVFVCNDGIEFFCWMKKTTSDLNITIQNNNFFVTKDESKPGALCSQEWWVPQSALECSQCCKFSMEREKVWLNIALPKENQPILLKIKKNMQLFSLPLLLSLSLCNFTCISLYSSSRLTVLCRSEVSSVVGTFSNDPDAQNSWGNCQHCKVLMCSALKTFGYDLERIILQYSTVLAALYQERLSRMSSLEFEPLKFVHLPSARSSPFLSVWYLKAH